MNKKIVFAVAVATLQAMTLTLIIGVVLLLIFNQIGADFQVMDLIHPFIIILAVFIINNLIIVKR